MTKSTVTAFCPAEQLDTEYSLVIDGTGEIVLTCTTEGCGSFCKLPRGSTVDDIKAYLVSYKTSSQGQIPVASIEGEQDALIAGLNE